MLEVERIAIRMKLEKLKMAIWKVSKNNFSKKHSLCNFFTKVFLKIKVLNRFIKRKSGH